MAIYLKPEGSDLASRHTAAIVRFDIERAVQNGEIVIVDLRDVLSISESYADELFGILVARYGLRWLGENVRISAQQRVLLSIATALKNRLERIEGADLKHLVHELVVAKRARSVSADL